MTVASFLFLLVVFFVLVLQLGGSPKQQWLSYVGYDSKLTGAKDTQRVVITSDRLQITDHSPAEGEGLSKEVVDGVKKFVFFMGWPRSGHSIVASLLNAHPNMVVSNEYTVLEKLDSKTTKQSLFDGIYRMSIPSTNLVLSTDKKGYTLLVENSWQGKFHQLQVIGDKRGGGTAIMEHNEYESKYKALAKMVGIPIRIICVVRNPFDIISTMLLYGENEQMKWKEQLAMGELSETNKMSFSRKRTVDTIQLLFERADAVKEHCSGQNAIIVHNVDLVHDTRGTMKQLCTFLEVECYEFYLQQCQEKVFSELSKSRKLVNWSQEQINEVERKMKDYHFFDRYSFHGD